MSSSRITLPDRSTEAERAQVMAWLMKQQRAVMALEDIARRASCKGPVMERNGLQYPRPAVEDDDPSCGVGGWRP